MRRFLRAAGLLAGLGAAAYLLRERWVRVPEEPGPPPHFRATSPNGEAAAPASAVTQALADDLTEINGIGPVYAGRLQASGITTFSGLAAADAEGTAETIDVGPEMVADWIAQARQRLS